MSETVVVHIVPTVDIDFEAEPRFWSKVEIGDPSECWQWQASKNRGYGQYSLRAGVCKRAHRYAYELAHGKPAPELLRHMCDNRACVNPHHVVPGTKKQNAQDRVARVYRGEVHVVTTVSHPI